MDILPIARIIANCALFLDLTDEQYLTPEAAAKMTEVMASGIRALDKPFLRELVDAFQVIAPEFQGVAQTMVANLAYDYHLEEAIAADDPVRLAELAALRKARGD